MRNFLAIFGMKRIQSLIITKYSYQIQHAYVAAQGTLLADRRYWFIPWVSASLGVGFNNAHNFQNTPLISEAVVMPYFVSNTKTSFSYTVGAGLQKVLDPHWQAGIGYEFSDWGQNQLGRAPGQTLNSGLYLNHLYTNGALFNLTYIAGASLLKDEMPATPTISANVFFCDNLFIRLRKG